ncbi:glycerol kinase [Streptococcus phage Javan420]|nr:glycerol kinase [Streptococcus phage Javan420]
MSGDAWISGNANVSGDAWVSGNAHVSDNASVSGNAWVFSNANVSGDAWISGNAHVSDNAIVSANVQVFGNAEICGSASVLDDNDYIVFKNNWSSGRYFTYTKSNKMWKVGCFYGTGEELIEKAYQDSEESGKKYGLYVNLVKELEN